MPESRKRWPNVPRTDIDIALDGAVLLLVLDNISWTSSFADTLGGSTALVTVHDVGVHLV